MIALLDLKPHPEGGHFRETFRDPRTVERGRAASTAMYFLLRRGERSHWHCVDAVETWHWYAGRPLTLQISEGTGVTAIVPAGFWQAAESRGDWSLCGCTVAPGFEFSGFDLAPRDWTPG